MRTLRSRASDRNDPAIRRATLSDHGYRGHRDCLPYSTPNARPVRISGHFPRFKRLNGRKVRVSRTLRRFSAAPPALASEADAPTGNLRHSPARRPRAQAAPRPRRTCTPSRWCGAQPTTTSPDGSPVTSNIGCEDVHPARPRPPPPPLSGTHRRSHASERWCSARPPINPAGRPGGSRSSGRRRELVQRCVRRTRS